MGQIMKDAKAAADGHPYSPKEKGITRIGYEDLKHRIIDRFVTPPTGLTSTELQYWLNGYHEAQTDILQIIERMEE